MRPRLRGTPRPRGDRAAGVPRPEDAPPGQDRTGPGEQPAGDGSSRVGLAAMATLFGEVLAILVEVLLVLVGIQVIMMDDDLEEAALLFLWSLLGAAYLLITVVVLAVVVRLPRVVDERLSRRLLTHPILRLVATTLTFLASVVGVYAALELVVDRLFGGGADAMSLVLRLASVSTVLVSWFLFHWGFARIYYARFHRADPAPLRFPRTERPVLVDFVYFSFTNATNFSVSDVEVTTTRMRWTVVSHTTISFFFNATILLLAINTVIGS